MTVDIISLDLNCRSYSTAKTCAIIIWVKRGNFLFAIWEIQILKIEVMMERSSSMIK